MANSGGAGTKFVSVNLNKSYGPVSNRNNNNNINNNNNSSSYGQAGVGRGRGGGGGMVVLSRSKTSLQKPGPKLSVPPPLNLPSLRKENQRFDPSVPGGGASGGGTGLSGAARPTSSGLGWTKPATLQDLSTDSASVDKFDQNVSVSDGFTRVGSAYMPPSARLGGGGMPPQLPLHSADKAAVLRGEDFPSLRAALPSGTVSGSSQKQKEATHQKQKQLLSGESANEHLTHRSSIGNGANENFGEGFGSGNLSLTSQARKAEDFFSGPLPLVRLNPRSDWADDERDTGHGFVERSKDYGYSNNEAYWDRDFDMPKNRVLPHKPADNQFQRWGKREDDSVRNTISEVPKLDPFVKAPSRDGNSWRAMDLSRENGRDEKYVPPRVGEYSRVSVPVNQNNRVSDRNTRDFYGNEQSNRFKGYGVQNSSIPKSTFSPSGKGFSVNDSVPNFGHEKRAFSISERTKPVDAFLSPESFDEHDPFSSALVGVIKRKKDVKQADFHDPVRESFEAELERVQKMQEQERRRISEEQERALEKARREEEERERLIREEEEHRRRVEEAAREAAWREERERLEATRRAEEQKIAREEERRNMIMEEERRKQAAKQKLLELEAKMAKRNNSVATSDNNKGTTSFVEKDTSRVADFESWEDSERMVERIMTPGSSDSSGPNRSFEPGHRSQPVNPWRREVLESGNNNSFIDHDNGHYSPRRDGPVGGRSFNKKVGHYYSGRNEENYAEDYPYNRSMDTYPEFHDNVPGKYGDGGWGQGRFQGNPHPPYPERLSSDGDELYPYGRSRYSMKQPRVLPPPSLVPMQKNERPGPSAFMRYNSSSGNESNMQMGYYTGPQETVEASELADVAQENNVAQKLTEKDSHSSLSVSSPPDSSAHFSHDDLDESGDSPTASAREGKPVVADTKSAKDAIVTGSGLTSDADEDWSIENNEKLQEQEEYDEDEDGYQVEDEVHEGDDDNIALNQEFNDLHIAEKDSPDMMENLVLGFDDGVEVRLPSGYGERSSSNEESALIDHEKTVDGKQGEIPTNTDPHTVAARDLLKTVDRSSINISSHSSGGQTVMPTVPVGSSPTDLPFKLQFGLFTGPPLIPSPIPAIQIGSIQMPLHIHPSVNPSLTQVHQSQAPLFQFGKLRFSTPISQGIVPIAPQMSFVQPNVQVGYNLNQNSVGQMHIQPKQEGLANNLIKTDLSSSSMGGGSNVVQRKVSEVAIANENNYMPDPGQENYKQANGTVSKGMHHSEDSRGLRAHGQQSGFKSKRFAYVARNSNVRSSFPVLETSRSNSGGFQRRPRRTAQRTEFRVRDNAENRPSFTGRNVGVFVKSAPKKGLMASNSAERMVEHEPSSSVQQTNSKTDEESSSTVENNPQSVERSLKMNLVYDEDVDAPLQSGVVRVFKQPGIEVPSDEDDFIQVRSKRQMLNDRREQREKEIKAKSRVMKAPRRVGPIAPSSVIPRSSNTKSAFGGELAKRTQSNVVTEGRGLTNIEASKVYISAVSQPLAPIGTPSVTSDVQADKRPPIIKSLQTGADTAISDSGNGLGSGLMFDTKNKIRNDVQTSLGSWGNSHINQQVMALTQTQLDEAMRPDRFDEHLTSTNGHGSSVVNPNMPSSSTLAKDKSFSSTASPVNSLLAGEKIQFGAVTSPTVLPPNSRAVSHVIRAPVSSRSEKLISHSLSTSESDCSMIFEKEKNQSEPRDHLGDAEAEAEAAASAVAVAAISSDESVSVSDASGFRCADINGVTGGMAGNQQLSSQSRAEESLSVALPADLSVETPISSWPPLPSPQGSSGQMLSHFPSGPSSPFPFYEMGPMMRGPIFAFGPHDESSGTQSQAQKSSVAGSGPLGPWQQFHSGPDSFYGPPAGFPGPYMGPHGGIPGVQGPPHMVVYNHFPVGQFGQVGLSFMGTTYIPSAKQPDWKHNHNNREGDINNMNMGSGQHNNTSGMASPVQHLAPPSQLLPMPSPLALFDVSQFQSAPDASVQGGWPHVTSSPLHSAPLSLTHQQHETGVLDYSQMSNRFSEPRTSIPSTDSASTQFPDDLGLVNSSSSNIVGSSIQTSTNSHNAKTDGAQSGGNNNNINTGHNNNTYKTRVPQPRNMPSQHQYNHHSSGYGYQRNRMGYNHGRNNSMAMDKSFPSKVKQIYVPKQTTNNGSTVG